MKMNFAAPVLLAMLATGASASTPAFENLSSGAALAVADAATALPIIEARRGRGKDNAPGDDRRGRGKGADDPAGHAANPAVIHEARRGRGKDDAPGDGRRGRGRGTDDGPNHT